MPRPDIYDPDVFMTPQVLRVLGMTRRQLQQFEESARLAPAVRGTRGPGRPSRWTLWQVVALSYGKTMMDVGLHPVWAYAVARWLCRQHRGDTILAAAGKGKTLVAMGVDGVGRMVKPRLSPHASREQRLMVAQLNLLDHYNAIVGRQAFQVYRRMREEEEAVAAAARAAAAERAAGQQAKTPKRRVVRRSE
jgi:hypothetical protein